MPFYHAPRHSSIAGANVNPLLDGLVEHWRLEEASGVRYASHAAHDLTDNNTVTGAVGRVGNAGQFTRANAEYLSYADGPSFSMGDIDFTLACWVRWDTLLSSQDGLITKWGGAISDYLIYYNNGPQRIQFGVNGSGGLVEVVANALGAPATATWYFVVAWHDSVGNTINIQVNNGTVNSTAHSLGVRDGDSTFKLGSWSSNHLDGRLDSVSVWKRLLTAGERSHLYNSGNGRDYPWN